MKSEGEKLINELPARGFPVEAGFWIQPSEDHQWYFYLISPEAEDDKLAAAYQKLHTAVRRMSDIVQINPLEIKLIGPDDSLAKAVVAVHRKFPGRLPLQYGQGGRNLSGISIDRAYFYPLPVAAV